MKVVLYIILSISIISFTQCEPKITVSINDIQIDTLKLHRVAKHKTIKGKLLTWRDTVRAIAAGEIKYVRNNNEKIHVGDTIMFLNMPDQVSSPRQKWIDHSAIKSLHNKISLLETTLQRISKLKQQKAEQESFQESDFEQLAVSLERTGIQIKDLQENVDFSKISMGIKQKIEKLKNETAKLEQKMNSNQVEIGNLPLISKFNGTLSMLVKDNGNVNPGDPLFYVKSENGEDIVIKLDQLPSDDMQFTVNVKMDDEVLKIDLKDFEEEKRILRVADDMIHHLEKANSTIRVSFESKPYEKLLVKRTAVYDKDNRQYVFVKRDGLFEAVNVKTGRTRGSMIEIVDGLQPNDQIIVSSSKPIWHLSHLEIRN
jgi:hypothetical protein